MKENLYVLELQRELRKFFYAVDVLFKSSGRLVQLWLKLFGHWIVLVSSLFLVRPRLVKRIAPNRFEEMENGALRSIKCFQPPNFRSFE